MLAPAGGQSFTGAGPRSPSTTGSTAAVTRPRSGLGHRRPASARAALALTALGLAGRASAEPMLPYVPTTILLPPDDTDDPDVAYIFAPSGDDANSVDLLAVDLSSTIRASSLASTKLTSPLPFLSPDNGNRTTFAPSMLANGTIAVVAGDCASGSPSLWTYTPGSKTDKWISHAITVPNTWSDDDDTQPTGPSHFGGALAFSAQLSPTISPPTIYLYGGMCPNTTSPSSSSSSDWQSSASYTNHMLRLSPSSPQPYTLSTTSQNNKSPQPIPAAGFTLTALPPSLTNLSAGAAVTQQTGHVLLGGHTAQAFVNMSTAAVWSLPEETWSFLDIAGPAEETGKGVEVEVDSRSGHTAVLSEDGTRLVVYGGWVGDVGQAATPQLAVVRMGVGLEGWGWEVPDGVGSEGAGVYGHGAVLLPGNVMMVVGGWEIGGGVKKRDAGGKVFFNITSMAWMDEYTNPLRESGGDGVATPGESGSADDSSRNRQIGLGVGLGVGLLLLLILAAFAVRFFRRRQRRRAARDETLRGLSQGVNGSLPRVAGEDDEMLERDHTGMFPWTAASARDWYTGGDDPYAQGRRSLGYESLRGGPKSGPSLYIPPPPTASSSTSRSRGAARGLYQPTISTGSSSAYDFKPLPNRIEPIYEADEDEDGDAGKGYPLSPERDDLEDPFASPIHTPVGGLFPPPSVSPLTSSTSASASANSPTPDAQPPQNPAPQRSGHEQDADVQDWVSDVDAAAIHAARQQHQHRRSNSTTTPPPARRKSSSAKTTKSTTAGGAGAGGGGRTSPSRRASSKSNPRHSGATLALTDSDSGRTGSNLSEASAFSFAPGGPDERVLRAAALAVNTNANANANANSNEGGGGGGGNGNSSSPSSSAHTFNTARSHNQNNNNGFAALQAEGPGLLMGRGEEEGGVEEEDYIPVEPGSPSKSKPPRRSRGWLGSLRRVFSGGTPESSSAGSGSPTRESLLDGGLGSSDYEARLFGAGGGLQRRRQGREAWFGDEVWGDESEWDVETAVGQRSVQVMFTVPRERLRVVNAEVETEEEQSAVVVDPDEESVVVVDADEGADRDAGGSNDDGNNNTKVPESGTEKGKDRLSTATLEPPVNISPSASLRTSPTLHTAEAVRLERPRTRVRNLVESIESRSRDGSPASSPARA